MNFRKEHYIESWKVFLLTFFTLGFYQIYWVFHTWKFVKEETGTKFSPAWRTIAQLLFPVIPDALLFYDVFLITTRLNRRLLLFTSIILAAMVLVYTNDIRAAHIGFALKILFLILELLLASTAFAIMQKQINKYLLTKVAETQVSLVTKRNSTNTIVFPINIISCSIVLIMVAFTKLDGNFYVLVSTMISIMIMLITIEIYEKKGKKKWEMKQMNSEKA